MQKFQTPPQREEHSAKRQKVHDKQTVDAVLQLILTIIKSDYQSLSFSELVLDACRQHLKDLRNFSIDEEPEELAESLTSQQAFVNQFLEKLSALKFAADKIVCNFSSELNEDGCKVLTKLLINSSCTSLTLNTKLSSTQCFALLEPWIENEKLRGYKSFICGAHYSHNTEINHAKNTFIEHIREHNTTLIIAHFKQNPKKQRWPAKLTISQINTSMLEQMILTETEIQVNIDYARKNSSSNTYQNESSTLEFIYRLKNLSSYFKQLKTSKFVVFPLEYENKHPGYEIKKQQILYFKDEHMPFIVEALLQNTSIVSLNLSHSGFTSIGLQQLWAVLPQLTELSMLDFSHSNLQDEDVIQLCQAIKPLPIHELYLQNNRFSDKGVIAVADLLESHRYLCKLNLSSNESPQVGSVITNVSLMKLASTLKVNKTLVDLIITGWNVEDTAVKTFVAELKQNTSLLKVDLYLPEVYKSTHGSEDRFQNYQTTRENQEKKKQEQARQKPIDAALKKNRERQAKMSLAVMEGKVNDLQQCLQQGSSIYTYHPETRIYVFHTAVKEKKLAVVRVFCNKNIHKRLPILLTENRETRLITPLELFAHAENPELHALLSGAEVTIVPVKVVKQVTLGNFFKPPVPLKPIAAEAPIPLPPAQSPAQSGTISKRQLQNYYAVINGVLNTETLIEADIHFVYPDGKTLLHLAAEYSQLNIVQGLLAKGANVNVKDAWGKTPLFYLAMPPYRVNDVAIVEALIASHADIDAVDITHRHVIFYMASLNDTAILQARDIFNAIARLIINHMSGPETATYEPSTDTENCTSLHVGIINGHYKLVQFLLKFAEYSIRVPTANGDTPLLLAVKAARPDILQLLLISDLSLDHTDLGIENKNGESAISAAKTLASPLNATEAQRKCLRILENFRKQQRPGICYGALWTKNFKLTYGNKHYDSPFLIDLNDVHHTLSNGLGAKQPANSGNTVSAAITLIISKGSYVSGNMQKEKVTTFLTDVHNPDFQNKFSNLERIGDRKRNPHNRDAIVQRLTVLPEDYPLSDNPKEIDPSKALSITALSELYSLVAEPGDPTKNYEQRFHHSEQHLLKLLDNPQNVKTLVEQLIRDERFNPSCKIFAVVLSIHSPRYVCADCSAGIIGEQNHVENGFLNLLATELKSRGYILPARPLRMITCVSSQIPFPYGVSKKRAEDHKDLVIDLRCDYGKRVLLQRDLESTAVPMANLRSGFF